MFSWQGSMEITPSIFHRLFFLLPSVHLLCLSFPLPIAFPCWLILDLPWLFTTYWPKYIALTENFLLSVCYGRNCDPPKTSSNPTPIPVNVTLLGNKGLCRHNQVRMRSWRLAWIQCNWCPQRKRRNTETDTHRGKMSPRQTDRENAMWGLRQRLEWAIQLQVEECWGLLQHQKRKT